MFGTYTFSAKAQSPVRVRMRSATGFSALYPHMRLYSPGGALLCQASGYPGTVEIDRCVVPADATYTLIATNYNGAGQGDYMLSLLCLAGDCGPAMPMATNYVPVVGR
ncbi:MAG: hypothetical protein IPO81_10270 [Kouleothrix sp.]|nr:hypothetical protein [Kouleothrix sp.]